MTVLKAGDHPIPLDQLHASLTHEQLRQHLAQDHNRPVPHERGPEAAKRVHRLAHSDHLKEVPAP